MTVHMCDIYGIKKYSQVEPIIAFTIEPISSCFLIHYIYTVHAIVVKSDDVRPRNRKVFWIFSYVHQYLVKLVWKYCLKWFIQVINNSNLMASISFLLFLLLADLNIPFLYRQTWWDHVHCDLLSFYCLIQSALFSYCLQFQKVYYFDL